MEHVLRIGEGRLAKNVYEARAIGGKKRGIHRFSWNDEVRRAAKQRSVWCEVPKSRRIERSGEVHV